MRRSSVIDINGIFVGAAVERDRSYRFIATDSRLEELHGQEFPSLREVRTAASATFFGGKARPTRRTTDSRLGDLRKALLTVLPHLAHNRGRMILLIDNYDSFTFNLVHFLGDLGARCEIVRNNSLTAEEALDRNPEAIVLSPGPCTPNEAGICLDLIKAAAGRVPLLGVCLGHQALGQAFGGEVIRAPHPMHGKVSPVHHQATDIFAGLPTPFDATRYHSLIVARETLPEVLEPTAFTADGIIMGLRHRAFPLFGVQFHPESIASQYGHEILANFLRIARDANTPSDAPPSDVIAASLSSRAA